MWHCRLSRPISLFPTSSLDSCQKGKEHRIFQSCVEYGTAFSFPRFHPNIAVEWHRYLKHASLNVKNTDYMKILDIKYGWVHGKKSPLEDTLEKQLTYWLKLIGINLFD